MLHLFDTSNMLSHPVTRVGVIAAGAALAITPIATLVLAKSGAMGDKTRKDVWTRYFTWLALAPAMIVPIILCPAGAIALVAVMSILCYREYARATGLFRERALSAIIVLGILVVALAAADHWYALFGALPPLVITILAAAAVLPDSPKGYIQRVALSSVAFLLFGSGLGHLGYIANDPNYRPILVLLIMSAQLCDIAAYICGKAFGHRKVFPNTSPNKTLGGHLGAIAIVTPLAAYAGHLIFGGTPLDTPARLFGLGLILSIGAQLGDLVLGSIKRDLGIKDMAATLPGHGGFLDRFNSLLLIAPAGFHYVGYFVGFGTGREPHAILRFLEGG